MKHAAGRLSVVLLALCVGLVSGAPSLHAQYRTAPRSTMVIRAQLEKSLSLQREATAYLEDPDKAVQLVYAAYVEMRAAHGSMVVNASSMTFPDPLFPQTDKRIEQARAIILRAHVALRDRATWSGGGNPIEFARNELTQSIRITGIVLATTF